MPEADRREKSSQRENLVRNTSGNPDSEARGAAMKIHRTALLAASLLLFQTLQMAAQEQAVLGQGNVLCGVWLENRRGDDIQVAARTAWVLGYITAFNQYGSKPEGDVSGGKDTEELMAWIDNYCRQNPADNVYRASAALVDQFRQRTGR
jgi:hypothetical protein